jgi:hypothetical protein
MQGHATAPGLIPLSVEQLFAQLHTPKPHIASATSVLSDVKLSCSFLEIYQEKVYDLLEPKSAECALRENTSNQLVVAGLAEVRVAAAAGGSGGKE